ncbi:MAG: class I SAM-dependent methyltransferase, partial [Mycobacterium sp.]
MSAGFNFSRDDVSYLRSDSGTAALQAVAGFAWTESSRVADIAAVRARFADRSPALVETTLLRRRAAAKFAGLRDVSGWLFTDEALQQASV